MRTPTGRHVQTGAARVFVREEGAGPPLLLLHGYAVSHLEWRQVIPLLSPRFRVLAPDLPGHGETGDVPGLEWGFPALADTLDGLLAALRAERAAVIGHSMGAAVALHLAVRHPARVSRLVLADAACYPTPLPAEGRLPLLPLIGRFLFHHVYSLRDFRRYFRTRVYRDPAQADEELMRYFFACFRKAREPGYRLLVALSRMDETAALPPRVACPTHVVWGEEDRIFPVAQAERLAGAIPGATRAVLPGCGHAPNEERPEAFVAAVASFLGG
jgi:pimeloyl-ACP methyl ester carboxylesterase